MEPTLAMGVCKYPWFGNICCFSYIILVRFCFLLHVLVSSEFRPCYSYIRVISGTHGLRFLTKALHIPSTYMAVFKRVRRKELNEQARRNIKGQLGLIYSGIYPGIYPGIFDIDYFTGLPTNFKTVPLGLRKGYCTKFE